MSLAFVAAAGGLALLAVLVAVLAGRGLRARHWVRAALGGLCAALLVAVAALAATIGVGIAGYRALTFEQVAATVRTEPEGPRRFRATITFPDRRLAMYDLAGDALYVDAHILKWHPWAALLGLHTAYQLDRVAGRYNDVAEERRAPHTVYAVGRHGPIDLFSVARLGLLGPLVDAEYGSATFVPATEAATYQVRVSPTGLLMRRVIDAPAP